MNADFQKMALVETAIDYAPSSIRNALLQDSQFLTDFDLVSDGVISIGDSEDKFDRTKFFHKLEKLVNERETVSLKSLGGGAWQIELLEATESCFDAIISRGETRIPAGNYAVFSSNSKFRLEYLSKLESASGFISRLASQWREILGSRPLTHTEFDNFRRDVELTPINVAGKLAKGIEQGIGNVWDFIPSDPRYYEQLIGKYDGTETINQYSETVALRVFGERGNSTVSQQFTHALLLSSHSALTEKIPTENLKDGDLESALTFIAKFGDRYSQLGAVEVALRIIPEFPNVEPIVIKLIQQIRDDDPDLDQSGFRLLSSLFLLIDGELAKKRIYKMEPPFYRRLAALTQASLVFRVLIKNHVEIGEVGKQASEIGSQCFYYQSLIDMRRAPRWNPDLADPTAVKADFFDRIIMAGTKRKDNIAQTLIYDLIFGESEESILSKREPLLSFYPGPLEGDESNTNEPPEGLLNAIRAQLEGLELRPSSFIALVNSAHIFRINSNELDLTAKTIKAGKYQLKEVENREQLLVILNGLATIAARSRDTELAQELRVLTRKYRLDRQFPLTIRDALHICIGASASHSIFDEWCDFVGDWITELAFTDLSKGEADIFFSDLTCVLHLVPDLWMKCGRAEAALSALVNTNK